MRKSLETGLVPQLTYNSIWDRWILSLPRATVNSFDTDKSYELVVRCAWQDKETGWFTYRFVAWDMGDWQELVTQKQYDERRKDIADHEGDDIASIWCECQTQWLVVHDDHPVFALRTHWEAMMTLGLFHPAANGREWENIPLSDDAKRRMDAVHEKQMESAWLEMRIEAAEVDEDRLGFGVERENDRQGYCVEHE